jgi:sugar phosphate isomerase/epimerase
MTNKTEFGVDLITFYDPQFWGVDDFAEVVSLGESDPLAMWGRILDSIQAAGISALELTFPPADWRSAVRAYGSAQLFRAELAERGLRLKSGFHAPCWTTETDAVSAADEAAEYAEFVHSAGGDTLVIGLPMRLNRDASPPRFIDVRFVAAIADILHAVGDATLRRGVRAAVHTEAHSMFCTRRDVDLLMALTDPTYVFACPDTAHLTLSGCDPVEVMRRHRDRMTISHWKDAIGPCPPDMRIDEQVHLRHQEYFRPIGDGTVDWLAWARLSREAQLTDLALLELDAVAEPVVQLTAARSFLGPILAATYGSDR